MGHSYHLSNFLHQLIVAHKQHKPSYTYNLCTNFVRENVKLLMREGLISCYVVNAHFKDPNLFSITVFLRYAEARRPMISDIRTYSTPGYRVHMSLKRIASLRRRSRSHVISFYVFSTPFGLLTDLQCIEKHTGGILLYSVNY